jgi:CheY-like chemotaxis protein
MAGRIRTFETLFPGSRRTILAALFAHPNRWWTVEELAGRAGTRAGSVNLQLTRLRECGIVRQGCEAERRKFQANVDSEIFAELQAIVMKLTASTGGETILVVEDTAATAQITRILLESWGYRAIEAHTPAEALDLFEEHGHEIELVLTDVMMPQMSGPQLADELRRRNPGVRIVFMSGYPDHELTQLDEMFLAKPFNPAGLSETVRKALDRGATQGAAIHERVRRINGH